MEDLIWAAKAHLDDSVALSSNANAVELAQLQALRAIACALIAIAERLPDLAQMLTPNELRARMGAPATPTEDTAK